MKLYSVTEAAVKIGITRNGIQKAIDRGDLKTAALTTAGYVIEEKELLRYDATRPRCGEAGRAGRWSQYRMWALHGQ